MHPSIFIFFFFNDTATTEIYTLSLHDALPISGKEQLERRYEAIRQAHERGAVGRPEVPQELDRKSTRLNSSHSQISYAVFCLKKKKKQPSAVLHTELMRSTRRTTCTVIAYMQL